MTTHHVNSQFLELELMGRKKTGVKHSSPNPIIPEPYSLKRNTTFSLSFKCFTLATEVEVESQLVYSYFLFTDADMKEQPFCYT